MKVAVLFRILNKTKDFVEIPKLLEKIVLEYNINKVFARCSPAGALALKLHNKTKVPFIVESFEPHADYMLESKVWSMYDPKYYFQKNGKKNKNIKLNI